MSKRLIVVVAVLLVLIVAASEALLPTVLSEFVAQSMRGLINADHVYVRLEKHPAVLMLGGQFDAITVTATNVKIDKIMFSEMLVALKEVQLDTSALLTRRQMTLQSVGDIDLMATVTQDELSRFLNQSVKGVKNAVVSITPEKAQVTSQFALGGFANVAITLDGKVVSDGQKIKFVTERFLLNNVLVGNIGGSLLGEIVLADLKNLPFSVSIRQVVMENGKVTVYTDNRSR
ncbi:MAG TPA: DUF2993 domain-containing protein [Negativicutes bacterium]|jgi:hypothetical protein